MDDYFNDDDLDDLFDDDDAFDKIMKGLSKDTSSDEFLEIRKEKAIRENYNHIKRYGIDILSMSHHGKENFEKLKFTIGTMLDYFEETEEFEKCAELKGIQSELEKVKF